jgi:hypothetical protein
MIGHSIQQRRPIDQSPVWLELGIANAGPVGRDDAHAEIARGIMSQLCHCARAGPAVTKENGSAAWITIFAERDASAVL